MSIFLFNAPSGSCQYSFPVTYTVESLYAIAPATGSASSGSSSGSVIVPTVGQVWPRGNRTVV